MFILNINIAVRHKFHYSQWTTCALQTFNLGITNDISGKKLSILEKLQIWLRNVVKYGKYSPAKLANLYTFVLRAEIIVTNLVTNSRT